MCRLQAAQDFKPWPTPWPCLAASSPGRFSPWLWRWAVWDKGQNTCRLVLKSFIGSKCKLTYSHYFVYLEYKKYSSSKSNQSCRQYPVDRLMITPNYIPCLGETHTKLYAMFKTERSLKSHTLFISISPNRPYKGVPPGHTGCRIQRSRSVRVRLDWLQSLSYSKICERVRYRTRSQTCVLSKWETARSRSTKA